MDAIEVKVRLFGVFRKLGNGSSVLLTVPRGATVDELRGHFRSWILNRSGTAFEADVVSESVFADEERILDSSERLEKSCTLATLPPICGG